MKFHKLAPLLLLTAAACVYAGENAMARIEQSCVKYPTPDARAECEKRQKETMAAFEKDQKAKKKAAEGEGKKANDLCFTRKATGEVVCPN